ncbi:6-phosphogluconate dehydrogenase [Flavobacterium alvei]|uniref:6-phosphogluconate dehydrogenase n=1 Tax=Flavobacterium alvei TaxID=2080416 RepID=A0A2S5A2K1_9FLAO|nr:6-phosphogluconate dehydrogenase [Flavobacterium alvei]POY36517.1 6-phosphogluconate dehydrogenase [Flavobacterium alvei]HQE35110.1 6-phosphogluconate dehydrogenase [Flavobacterium alvei]HQF47540.1 6-phosphogluconate dehydrogenase [Flavobacterium alvei]HQK38480.1 6-phosphogluconate dehydrogenase [Flavobacterium alvei]
MKKILIIITAILTLVLICYFAFLYNATYSEGVRSGELIKFSSKGIIFKTYEGELSQGISGAQIFSFSVLDSEEKVISDLKELEGHYVKLTYIERYKTFPWWGDSKYFIIGVQKEESPFKIK